MSKATHNLDLHEAMVLLLLEQKADIGLAAMTSRTLSIAIRVRKLYRKRDGGFPSASQVSARARQYPSLFDRAVVEGKLRVRLRDLTPRSRTGSQPGSHQT